MRASFDPGYPDSLDECLFSQDIMARNPLKKCSFLITYHPLWPFKLWKSYLSNRRRSLCAYVARPVRIRHTQPLLSRLPSPKSLDAILDSKNFHNLPIGSNHSINFSQLNKLQKYPTHKSLQSILDFRNFHNLPTRSNHYIRFCQRNKLQKQKTQITPLHSPLNRLQLSPTGSNISTSLSIQHTKQQDSLESLDFTRKVRTQIPPITAVNTLPLITFDDAFLNPPPSARQNVESHDIIISYIILLFRLLS